MVKYTKESRSLVFAALCVYGFITLIEGRMAIRRKLRAINDRMTLFKEGSGRMAIRRKLLSNL